jgi:flagellar motility protein MotE (MotC chaperone)
VTPDITGTIPQWITAGGMVSFLGILAKWHLGQKKIAVDALQVRVEAKRVENADAADVRDHLADEVKELRAELRTCEKDCDRRLGIAEARIRALDEELWGEKKQRVAEQISLINVILNSVDAPELKTLLKTFESVKTHLGKRAAVGGEK